MVSTSAVHFTQGKHVSITDSMIKFLHYKKQYCFSVQNINITSLKWTHLLVRSKLLLECLTQSGHKAWPKRLRLSTFPLPRVYSDYLAIARWFIVLKVDITWQLHWEMSLLKLSQQAKQACRMTFIKKGFVCQSGCPNLFVWQLRKLSHTSSHLISALNVASSLACCLSLCSVHLLIALWWNSFVCPAVDIFSPIIALLPTKGDMMYWEYFLSYNLLWFATVF